MPAIDPYLILLALVLLGAVGGYVVFCALRLLALEQDNKARVADANRSHRTAEKNTRYYKRRT